MTHISCLTAAAVMLAVSLCRTPQSEVLSDSALLSIEGGPNCASPTPISSGCTDCQENPPDYSEKCNQIQMGSACMGYVGIGRPDCQTQTPYCGGQAKRWSVTGCPEENMNFSVVTCEKRYPATDTSGSEFTGECP